ncbi:MAG: mechanosensitive ion channel [Candidatus Cloacimonetes bacterium]|nr:mechanosensitive ion channel [Candidatus Cloacimonadota bacterium]
MEELVPQIMEWGSTFGIRLISAIVILIVGSIVIKFIRKLIIKIMGKRLIEKAIITFTASLINIILWVFVILAALSQIGIETTSFIAVIGAAGLAVGFALQGTLANFAAGLLIIFFKPFRVGDAVEAAGVLGAVHSISMFSTVFKSFDNKTIIIPNSQIMSGVITNYTTEGKRRVDFKFGVSYDSDIKKVKGIIKGVIDRHQMIHKDPEPFIRLGELADSSLNFTVRAWANTEDYWTVFFDVTEQVKEEFDKNNISIPFPQMDVHVKNQ